VFWIPAASIEFGCYLARSLAKGSLDDRRIRRLEHRYQDDPKSCESEIARLWTGTSAAVLRSAARSSDWSPVLRNQPAMSSEFRWRRMTKHPLLYGGSKLAGLFNRAKRAFQPHGLSIVVLGPDGAGKSSVIDAMGKTLAPIFSRSVCWSFAPPLRRLLRRPDRPTNQPHALGRRSLPVSLIRAGYWFVFNTLGYAYLPWTLARSVLVLYDRHFIDIFVDSERYRYGGPMWLLRLIWRFTPRPDLVILLDAPPEVLQARKQEVPLEVTARQCRDYRALVRTLENGRVIDSAQALGDVINDANSLVVEYLAARHLRRHGLEPAGSSCAALPPQQALE
jgi:thymidylate kinase